MQSGWMAVSQGAQDRRYRRNPVRRAPIPDRVLMEWGIDSLMALSLLGGFLGTVDEKECRSDALAAVSHF